MHIIYHCVGGSHSSCIAAAIHLNLLPKDRIPDKHDLLNIPFYDALQKVDRGKILYRGKDEFKNKIYTLGRQFVPHLVIPAIQDMWQVLGQKENDLLLVDTLPTVNWLMKIGGFASRRLGWIEFGRPIVTRGTLNAYEKIMKIVEETKKKLN